mgnify:FL=1
MNGRKNKYKTMRNRGQKGTAVFFIYQEKIRKLTVCRLVTPSIHAVSRDGAKFMVVLIGLVIIFKSQLTSLVESIFEKITSESGRI